MNVFGDLRNSLQGITGVAYLLKEKIKGSVDEEGRELFGIIENCIQYISLYPRLETTPAWIRL
jgi:nitrogen-specific signal transduction histidine kinase